MKITSLDKGTIVELLSKRFNGVFKTLQDIPNPSLLHDGDKAAKRIAHAIKNNENITIVGDYDVDGVTSTAIMVDFFKQIDYPITAIIPNRFKDGYGISPSVLDRVEQNDGVIITVDNGINAVPAATVCKDRGIDLIITDHHTPSEILPDCYALVDPKLKECNYPFKEICGAQVAWLVLNLVKKALGLTMDMRVFFDLLAIAIIADVMPLVDINRVLVQKGLAYIANSPRPSMQALCMMLDKQIITAEDVGFQLAPRINAAGRMEDASYALNFLTAPTLEHAMQALETLTKLNTYRKDIEMTSTKRAMEQVNPEDKIIVVAMEHLHEGVVGIIASRIVDKFERPTIVLNIENGVAKGSARSIGEVNLYNLLDASKHHLLKFGGHKMAGGMALNVSEIDAFRTTINAQAFKLPKSDFIPLDEILGELYPNKIDFELLEAIEAFEPFGEANRRPKFIMKETKITDFKRMGELKNHFRFSVESPILPNALGAVSFNNETNLQNDSAYSFTYTLNKNEFRGNSSIQLMLDRVW